MILQAGATERATQHVVSDGDEWVAPRSLPKKTVTVARPVATLPCLAKGGVGRELSGLRTDGREGQSDTRKTPRETLLRLAAQFREKDVLVRMHLSRVGPIAIVEAARDKCRVESANVARTSGLGCISAMQHAGRFHQSIETGSETPSGEHSALCWVHTILGNVKPFLNGSNHHLSSNHLSRYLANLSRRFSCRLSRREMFTLPPYIALRTLPMLAARSSCLGISSR